MKLDNFTFDVILNEPTDRISLELLYEIIAKFKENGIVFEGVKND